MYICPMHDQIRERNPGKCPICGMKLISQGEVKKTNDNNSDPKIKSYVPLIVVISLLVLISIVLGIRDNIEGVFSLPKIISYFMIGFFLTFSAFKLMDLQGFAEGYAMYDLLAKKVFAYGFIYPFIELFFGLAMIIYPKNIFLLILEIIIMVFSGAGVLVKILKREKFQCSCLGTFLKVPLTKVTLIEDFGMAFLAFLLIILK